MNALLVPTIQIVLTRQVSVGERWRLRSSERFPHLIDREAELGENGIGHRVIVALAECFAGN